MNKTVHKDDFEAKFVRVMILQRFKLKIIHIFL